MKITRRCPKCKKIPCQLREVSSCGMWFDVGSDGTIVEESVDASPLDILYVNAICECGHRWKLRGINQITDLKKESL